MKAGKNPLLVFRLGGVCTAVVAAVVAAVVVTLVVAAVVTLAVKVALMRLVNVTGAATVAAAVVEPSESLMQSWLKP